MNPIVNALTVDVEDYFQVSAFAPYIDREWWGSMECRIERNVDRLLIRFEAADAKATFFTLGWIAQRYPQVVRRIVGAGHELASHGYGHLRASQQNRQEFVADIESSKKILEDISGARVTGYRAPSFSIGSENMWAFDCLQEAGYLYSSSIYPVQHDHYGMPNAPRFAFNVGKNLTEIPVSTVVIFGRNWPAGGGGYFRLRPYLISRWAISRLNIKERQPAVFYLHPWEIDPKQPRVPGIDLRTRFRHYINLNRTELRLQRLLDDFKWDRVDRVFNDVGRSRLYRQDLKSVPSLCPLSR